MKVVPAILTIAGSDSGGGAGIQADLKTFGALDCFGLSAITCVTAQNPDEVRGVEPLTPEMVRSQIAAVCAAFPVAAAKTGMLYSAEIITAVAEAVTEFGIPRLVVDPVMISTSKKPLLREDAAAALREKLLPKAMLITPNLPEAEALSGGTINSLQELREAAAELGRQYQTACVLKGGHLDSGNAVIDILWDGSRLHEFRTERVAAAETHGTGCTFAAAAAAGLSRGASLPEAVAAAQAYVAGALRAAVRVGDHTPLGIPEEI